MPKRKIKEEKPKKRLGKKEMLIVPIAMGGATLVALVIIPLFAPPPNPAQVCLKAHEVEQFQLHPRVQVVVDGQMMLLPDTVGKQPKNDDDCLRPLHTDEVGNVVHIEYIRPVKFTVGDFMTVYNITNTIAVVDNSTGANVEETLNLTDYNIGYSYFSEAGEFTQVANPFEVPAFPANNQMVARIELTSKQ